MVRQLVYKLECLHGPCQATRCQGHNQAADACFQRGNEAGFNSLHEPGDAASFCGAWLCAHQGGEAAHTLVQ
jgi:hypothetical protein